MQELVGSTERNENQKLRRRIRELTHRHASGGRAAYIPAA